MLNKRRDELEPGWHNLFLLLKVVILGSIIGFVIGYMISFLWDLILIGIVSIVASVIFGVFAMRHVAKNFKVVPIGFAIHGKLSTFSKFYFLTEYMGFPLLCLNFYSLFMFWMRTHEPLTTTGIETLYLVIGLPVVLIIIELFAIYIFVNKDLKKIYIK